MSESGDVVEVGAAELAQLRRGFDLLNGLLSDPKRGIDLKRALVEKDPTLNFPELAAQSVVEPVNSKVSELEARLTKMQEEREAEAKARADQGAEQKLRTSIDAAKSKYKLTEDGVNGLIKFMTEKQIADAELAAPAYLETVPKAPDPARSAPAYLPSAMNLFGSGDVDESLSALHQDPVKWQDAEIVKILNEAA